jgi:hypothetical protein
MFEILIGLVLLVLVASPRAKFYRSGAPATKYGDPIEPRWIPRLLIMFAAIAVLVEGLWRIFHR